MATAEALMTAEEFALRADPGYPEELVQGRVVRMPLTDPRHGEVCIQAAYLLKRFLEDLNVGRVIGNDAGVITERAPDSVRGPDVAYYSYERVPRGPLPRGYLAAAPELVFEVRSKSDRWRDIYDKISEFLNAGVLVAIVLDPTPMTAHVFSADEAPRTLSADDQLSFPGLLEGFQVRVGRFFEE
jgi:Uma2 family endonuclease